ncbi:MAG: selenocysteine-specific translation elongation factor [Rhodocyclaceae bacterium]|nr:selenocysteine-specific translation elongation factor [Rhodocyclaceae bacterium]
MIIGTAGHIDHGKTTLVKALTGVDCDRLPEEKARGMTLDLGYAYVETTNGQVLGFVDVPGHERLVHNMLAGATGIDFVLLVVAADDGVMPQTREHLELLRLLGLARGAVALTKCDAVERGRIEEAEQEVRMALVRTPWEAAPIFRTSSKTGEGIAELRAHLVAEAQQLSPRSLEGGFRLAIDRVFTLMGTGTVVTGTAHAGMIRAGEVVALLPSQTTTRIKSLRAQDRPAEEGRAGERIALALAGVEKHEIERGMWLVTPMLAHVLDRFHAEITPAKEAKPLRHLQAVHVHLGTADITGRVALLDREDALAEGESAFVEILLDRPTHALYGDRFVLRDASAQSTLAGGRVLEVFPPRRRKRSPAHLSRLAQLATGDLMESLRHGALTSSAGVDLSALALSWNVPRQRLLDMAKRAGLWVCEGSEACIAFDAHKWWQWADDLCEALRAEHARSPDSLGVTRERLKRMCAPSLSLSAFVQLVEQLLAAGRIAQTQAFLHLPEHSIEISAADEALFATLKPLLATVPFNPPRVREVARASGLPEDRVRQLFRRMARAGRLFCVAHDHYFLNEAVARLAEIAARVCEEKGAIRAAEFRDQIFADGRGGRKVAIHILEFFDRMGYTRRVKDEHRLRAGAKWLAQ